MNNIHTRMFLKTIAKVMKCLLNIRLQRARWWAQSAPSVHLCFSISEPGFLWTPCSNKH